MGLEFLGNPYENNYEDDSDVEIDRDEEWVVPVDINPVANRQNLAINYWSLSDEGSDFSSFEDDPNDEDFNPEDFWDEDEADNDDNVDDQNDSSRDAIDVNQENEDNFLNPDDENYPEYDEIEDVFAQNGPESYNFEVDDFDDGDFDENDTDYVTYPIEAPKPPEPSEKFIPKNNDNNANTNNSESTTNSTIPATLEPHDD